MAEASERAARARSLLKQRLEAAEAARTEPVHAADDIPAPADETP
jgi:hypothetical protein